MAAIRDYLVFWKFLVNVTFIGKNTSCNMQSLITVRKETDPAPSTQGPSSPSFPTGHPSTCNIAHLWKWNHLVSNYKCLAGPDSFKREIKKRETEEEKEGGKKGNVPWRSYFDLQQIRQSMFIKATLSASNSCLSHFTYWCRVCRCRELTLVH